MFDEMVSEKLIEWIWILASIGVVIFGLLMMFAGGGFFGFVMAVMYIAIGMLVARVICESMMVAFKMHENNRRSLAVMEQIGKDQSATRQAIQSFLAQAAASNVAGATPPTTPIPTVASQPVAASGSYGGQMAAAREQLQQRVRVAQSDTKSKLGDWPGTR